MIDADVRLRAMEPEDLDFLYAMENDRGLWNVGNTNVPYSRYVLHDYIANATNDIYRDGQVRMIIENGRGEAVGMADLFDFNAQHRRAEVSVAVCASCRRRGYASAAMRFVADYARRVLHLHQVYAIVAASNVASLGLFRKCGFQQSATLRGWLFDGENYADAIVMSTIF